MKFIHLTRPSGEVFLLNMDKVILVCKNDDITKNSSTVLYFSTKDHMAYVKETLEEIANMVRAV